MIGVSRTTPWRMVRDGLFPAPVRITTRNRGYVLADVEAWMRDRVEPPVRPSRDVLPRSDDRCVAATKRL
jgi:Prophage CP4-57 regulatory protein (AlpA)